MFFMKIALVNSPFLSSNRSNSFQYNLNPPLGILYLASYLRKYLTGNNDIKLVDGVLLGGEKTLDEILRSKPDIVGISVVTPNALGGYQLANKIRKTKPNTLIIFGGVHASALPEEVFEKSKADLVVTGEGEQTLLEIVKARNSKNTNYEKIPGLVFKKRGKIVRTPPRKFIQNLDNLPFPAYDLLDNRELYTGWVFKKNAPEAFIMSTRGCPFHCFFCTDVIWKSSRPHLRMRSPKNIVDELEWHVKKFGIKEFYDGADEFNCVESWSIAVCQEIIKRKLQLTWKCQLRADRVSEEFAKNLAQSGCWYVCLGVESGNQRTIDGIHKQITLKQVEVACRNLKKYDIKISLLLMLFNIWEENGKLAYEGVKESLNTLKFARHLIKEGLADFFGPNPTVPLPGSPLYNFSLKKGVIPRKIIGKWEEWNYVRGIPLNLPKISSFDYAKVKSLAIGMQSWYLLTRMGKGAINFKAANNYAQKIKGVFSLFSKIIKASNAK